MRLLDLSAKERPTVGIILPDGMRLDVFTPTKSLRETFTFLGDALTKVANKTATDEDLDTMYDITARILSRNKQSITLSKSDLEERTDIEDITAILAAYIEFLTETVGSKN